MKWEAECASCGHTILHGADPKDGTTCPKCKQVRTLVYTDVDAEKLVVSRDMTPWDKASSKTRADTDKWMRRLSQ